LGCPVEKKYFKSLTPCPAPTQAKSAAAGSACTALEKNAKKRLTYASNYLN